jgi:hypothetical protein
MTSSAYSDVETDGLTLLTIPFMATANKACLKLIHGTGLRLCPMTGFGIGGVEPLNYTSRESQKQRVVHCLS